MKPNWTLIAGSFFVVAIVFSLAVLDGVNSIERPAHEAAQLAAR